MTEHIVHVGYHKTGTTWLQSRVFPTVTGATFVSNQPVIAALAQNLVVSDRFMEAAFKAAINSYDDRLLISRENLVGTPWGPSQPESNAARLARVVPGARIVIVMRERDELRRSLYAQYVNEGGYLSFENFTTTVLSPTYLDMGEVVADYRRHFTKVLVTQYGHLKADRAAFLRQFEEFAEVQFTIAGDADTRVNPSLRGWRLRFLRTWNRHCRQSALNSDPTVNVPAASAMRWVLQASLRNA